MKIAFIVTGFPTLSETFILNQITGLIDRGHEVDIYAGSAKSEPVSHADVERYNLLQRTHYMGANGTMPRHKILRLFKGVGYAVTTFPKRPRAILNSLNALKYGKEAVSLQLLYQIKPFLDRGPYDVVHGQFGPNGILAALLRDRGAFHGKVVTSFHGYDVSSYLMRNGSHVYDELFDKGDLFLCVSKRIQDKVLQLGCPESKTLVHRTGANTSRFRFIPRAPIANRKLRLLTIARLIPKKGVQYGIHAVARLLKKYPDIEYKIVGDGQLRGSLERLIDEMKVGRNIRLVGWKCRDEILDLLAEADVFLTPSVTGDNGDEEGIPVVLMEALARGLPVVSTQHSGIPELIQDGVCGFLVPERDVDALADKLQFLMEHPDIRVAMGRAGRKYVEQDYDIEKLNDRLVGIYGRVVRS